MLEYSTDKTTQILLALLKVHGIKKIIASPGTTNMCLVASMQSDPYFEMYSCVDERSAAYMACGLSYESGEPVVITCTEATASRDYLPGLTEAYYRKLPILCITGYHNLDNVGHLQSQVIDRSQIPCDAIKLSLTTRVCKSADDEWFNEMTINKAILGLTHNGGGPVPINIQFPHERQFTATTLPQVRVIKRITSEDSFPSLPSGNIAVFVGSHKPWSYEDEKILDKFCESNNAVVFCDHTSGYHGKYRMNFNPVFAQRGTPSGLAHAELLIHIGEVSGDTYAQSQLKACKSVWRVSEDGEVRDPFKKLKYIFQMRDLTFLSYYCNDSFNTVYFDACIQEKKRIMELLPEYEFSNLWIANQLSKQIPSNSFVQLGIFNSLRSWNMVEMDESVQSNCNVGGFGIDGTLSSALGASLAYPNKIHFCICGDLAFFYDMNSLCNRHVGNNLRILLVNNGRGIEFRNYSHPAYALGNTADPFIAASGHNGNQSKELVKAFVENLGFLYLSASNKEEFLNQMPDFVSPQKEAPVVFEVFTTTEAESNSLKNLLNAQGGDTSLKSTVQKVIGEKGTKILKSIIGK